MRMQHPRDHFRLHAAGANRPVGRERIAQSGHQCSAWLHIEVLGLQRLEEESRRVNPPGNKDELNEQSLDDT
jgi:hypothetical protein